jgi:magnesium-transporting ATPase (P-type)
MARKERYRIDELVDQINRSKDSDPIAFEVGKTLLLNTLESGREFCKVMLPVAITAAGVYFGLLSWSWPRTASEPAAFSALEVILILVPVMHFLVAALAYSAGYFGVVPITQEDKLTIRDEYRRTRQRRIQWLIFGGIILCLGITAALSVLIDFRTASNFAIARPVISIVALLTAWVILRSSWLFFEGGRRVLIALTILITTVTVSHVFFGLTGVLVGLLGLLSISAILLLLLLLLIYLFFKAMEKGGGAY